MARVRRMTTPAIPGGPRRCVVRLSTSRFAFFALFLLLCLAAPHGVASAYGAARVTGEDVSLIEWSHGTNSRWKLEQALSGRAAPYVEADVSQADGMAVMAHPPVRSWDLSLREFLRIVCGTPRNVTLKLDFKASEVLESAFLDMESAPLENLRDLWLNADIVEGPGGRPDVDAQHFLQLCTSRFPQATLSLGWTTRPMSSYSWAHVEAMARLLVCGPYRVPRVTFPVRASMLAASTPQLLWLLDVIPGSTLTVWSSPRDPWSTKALMKIRNLLPLTAVYYDLPTDQKQDFDRVKALVSSPTPHNQHVDDGPLPEWSLGIGYSCQHRALAGKRAVVLAGPGARLLMPDKWDQVEAKVDLSRVGSLALGWGQHADKVQINGGCFYITLTNGPNVTAQVWASPCLPTTSSFDEEDHDKKGETLRSGKPLVTRQWPSSPSPPTQTSSPTPMVSAPPNSLLFESPGAAVVYDVRISSSSAVSRATSLTALLLLCLATALAAFLLC
uniref:Protein, containing DUF2181 domain n=1 Tax=Rhipicephalus zambeziensis TaxID=60191 RepID=A0A224YPA8_9ACAR